MSDIYLLIIEDRHTDVDVQPYSSEELAMAAFSQALDDLARSPGDIDAGLNVHMIADGWIANATYSVEGDAVRVIKRPLDVAYR